jgi:NAD(P)-dependent dehydrogenase (short-subunit alcohol dehydrogenase family)
MKISYKGYNVVVTGASRGIGKSIADAYFKLGANVIGTSATKEISRKNYRIIKANFLNQNDLNYFIQELKKIKSVDILINNAGINRINNISNVSDEDIHDLLEVNLISSIKISREVSNKMIKRKYGKILNISSIFGVVSKNKRSIYSTTKFALNGFTKGLSLDLAKNNIQVNSICPGVVETELTKKILGNIGMKKIRSEIPLGRLAKVKEISNLVIFLTSEYCNYITGQNIIIDGGYTAK